MARSYLYIRKSVVQRGANTLSWEIQQAEALALAARHGDEPEIISDWGRSGRGEKTHLRPGYARLLEEIAADRVTVVYAYSLSRLTRSTVEYGRLAELCVAHGVKLRLCKEGETDFSSVSGRMVVGILMVIAQMEAELAQERSRDMIRARKARGDVLGRQPYGARPGEDLEVVLETYRAIGSWSGTARRLNELGLPTRGGGMWHGPTIRSIVETRAPELAPVFRAQGVARMGTQLLTQLVKCHCGAMMTPQRNGKTVRYRCWRSRDLPGHGKNGVQESAILPWVRAELALVRPPDAQLQVAEIRDGRREEVRELLRRNLVAFQVQAIDDATFLSTKKALDTELEQLDSEGRVVSLDAPDWDRDAKGAINEWARGFLEYVQLDESMRPVAASWLLPEWRAPEPRAA